MSAAARKRSKGARRRSDGKRVKGGKVSTAHKGKNKGQGRDWELARTLLFAVLIAFGVRSFIIEPFRIPSGSMLPTLLIGDHLFVNKFIYGIKLPFTEARHFRLREPRRGDVIVFTVAKRGSQTYPADKRPDFPREAFVKRIVGIPGDRIAFRDGTVYVNGEAVDSRTLGEVFRDDLGRELEVREVSLDSRTFRTLDDPRLSGPVQEPMTVQPGRYFVLGDNRDHSKDSRIWGTVRLAEIKGPAFLIYFSWDFNGGWLELLNPLTWWRAEKRWHRIGDSV